jgi:hypothetical protein
MIRRQARSSIEITGRQQLHDLRKPCLFVTILNAPNRTPDHFAEALVQSPLRITDSRMSIPSGIASSETSKISL